MPDHIHLILFISHSDKMVTGDIQPHRMCEGRFPTVSEIIQRFKTITTKLYIDGVKRGLYPPFNKKIWQKSFNDRIIRSEIEYQAIWKYIDENPLKSEEDEWY
ncbi:hypothetical protein SDC9_174901 [bioreactor metagenome]|uniref:Transposase IS200-like domain-containing protein n=1 Tax=bioreactor metagenome TaxID=1076179 RepID=A0A645GKQ4_9ZZZZ